MTAHADNLTKPRWFRALTTLGQALRRIRCAGSARETSNLILRQKFLRYYLKVIAIVLILTALLKIAGSLSTQPYLIVPDPLLFFVGQRWVLLLAAFAELACAGVIAFRSPYAGLWVTTWLLVLFGIYRVGIHALGAGADVCPCLGYWLPMSPKSTHNLSLGLFYFMVIGNTCGLAICWNDWKASVFELSQESK